MLRQRSSHLPLWLVPALLVVAVATVVPGSTAGSYEEDCASSARCSADHWTRDLGRGRGGPRSEVAQSRISCQSGGHCLPWQGGLMVGSPALKALPRGGKSKQRHVTLAKGELLSNPWRASIYRRGKHQPCYEVMTQTSGVSTVGGECGRARRGFIPVLLSQSGNGPSRGNVILLITPMKVHRVRLRFGGRANKSVWPKRVSSTKAQRAGLHPDFRYKLLARRGRFCLRRHVDFDARGRVFYRSLRYPPCRKQ